MPVSKQSNTRAEPARPELFLGRKERLIRLLKMNAPDIVIASEAILIAEAWHETRWHFLWSRIKHDLEELIFQINIDLGITWYLFRGRTEEEYWQERCGLDDDPRDEEA
jgi:hypothetical protein